MDSPHVGRTQTCHPLHRSLFPSWIIDIDQKAALTSSLRLHLLPLLPSIPSPLPHDGIDLPPQALGRDLGLENAAHAPPPRLVQPRDLATKLALQPLPPQRDEVDAPPRGGDLALQGAQLRLELPVAHQPRVLAVAVEQREVLTPRGEVCCCGVGLAQGGLEGFPVGAFAVLGKVGEFVPRQVYRA